MFYINVDGVFSHRIANEKEKCPVYCEIYLNITLNKVYEGFS